MHRRLVADLAGDRLGGEGEREGEAEHDGGVAQREEEADPERPLPVGHQLSRGVVDGRDVVGVEGMPQSEAVGGHAGAEADRRVLGSDECDQSQPADDMQGQDSSREPSETSPFAAGEGPAHQMKPGERGRHRRSPLASAVTLEAQP